MNSHSNYQLDDFDFSLPEALIAQHPATTRSGSRLLQVAGEKLVNLQFSDLPSLLSPGNLLILNDTRVFKARFFGEKASGGKIEVLIERVVDDRNALAHIRASKSPKAGARLRLEDSFEACVGERQGEFFTLTLGAPHAGNWWDYCERHGRLPLPPYITHAADAVDAARYQTVYARHAGAVAAPTAGLHFDEALLAELQAGGVGVAYVTLHVGAGTFQPVRMQDLDAHPMHREQFEIPAATVAAIDAVRAAGKRVIAVGTTSLRALESATPPEQQVPVAGPAETALFIRPGYHFRCVDALITNFHLPKSTLLMLVSAFAGYANIRHAYQHAIDTRYRFFSYGDAMFLERPSDAI